jgi:hypothetical protein
MNLIQGFLLKVRERVFKNINRYNLRAERSSKFARRTKSFKQKHRTEKSVSVPTPRPEQKQLDLKNHHLKTSDRNYLKNECETQPPTYTHHVKYVLLDTA